MERAWRGTGERQRTGDWSREFWFESLEQGTVLSPGNNGSETGMRATELVWCRLEIRIASARKSGHRVTGEEGSRLDQSTHGGWLIGRRRHRWTLQRCSSSGDVSHVTACGGCCSARQRPSLKLDRAQCRCWPLLVPRASASAARRAVGACVLRVFLLPAPYLDPPPSVHPHAPTSHLPTWQHPTFSLLCLCLCLDLCLSLLWASSLAGACAWLPPPS